MAGDARVFRGQLKEIIEKNPKTYGKMRAAVPDILLIYQVRKHVFQPSSRKYSEKKMFSSNIMIFAIRSCAIFM